MTASAARPVAFGDAPAAPGLAPVGGFVALPNAVLLAPGLSRDAKLLYAVLLHYARQAGSCYPGRDRLRAALGCGHHQLAAYLRELEAAGLVARRRRGGGRTTLYTLRAFGPAPSRPGKEAPCSHTRPAGPARGMPTRPEPVGVAGEASPGASAAPPLRPPRAEAEAPPLAPRPTRKRYHERPETGAVIGPKPDAEEDSGDQDAGNQQQPPPPERRPDGSASAGDTTAAVVALLVQQGVTRGVAEALAAQHPLELIRRQVECHRHRVTAAGLTRNPAGALVRAIREAWAPPAAWTAAQTRAAVQARQAEEEGRRAEAEAARQREWLQRPPEERIAGRLQFWVMGRRAKRQEPTAAEIAVKRAELLAQLRPAVGGVS